MRIFKPSKIIIKDKHAEIILCDVRSKEIDRAIIDVDDVEKVKKFRWRSNRKAVMGRYKEHHVLLSHIIMGKTTNNIIIDHIDRNILNNRKLNLRTCTNSQNMMNRPAQKNNTSGFKGVCWDKSRNKWIVHVTIGLKQKHLGRYFCIKKAALAYNEGALKYHKKFARLNAV